MVFFFQKKWQRCIHCAGDLGSGVWESIHTCAGATVRPAEYAGVFRLTELSQADLCQATFKM